MDSIFLPRTLDAFKTSYSLHFPKDEPHSICDAGKDAEIDLKPIDKPDRAKESVRRVREFASKRRGHPQRFGRRLCKQDKGPSIFSSIPSDDGYFSNESDARTDKSWMNVVDTSKSSLGLNTYAKGVSSLDAAIDIADSLRGTFGGPYTINLASKRLDHLWNFHPTICRPPRFIKIHPLLYVKYPVTLRLRKGGFIYPLVVTCGQHIGVLFQNCTASLDSIRYIIQKILTEHPHAAIPNEAIHCAAFIGSLFRAGIASFNDLQNAIHLLCGEIDPDKSHACDEKALRYCAVFILLVFAEDKTFKSKNMDYMESLHDKLVTLTRHPHVTWHHPQERWWIFRHKRESCKKADGEPSRRNPTGIRKSCATNRKTVTAEELVHHAKLFDNDDIEQLPSYDIESPNHFDIPIERGHGSSHLCRAIGYSYVLLAIIGLLVAYGAKFTEFTHATKSRSHQLTNNNENPLQYPRYGLRNRKAAMIAEYLRANGEISWQNSLSCYEYFANGSGLQKAHLKQVAKICCESQNRETFHILLPNDALIGWIEWKEVRVLAVPRLKYACQGNVHAGEASHYRPAARRRDRFDPRDGIFANQDSITAFS
ncbi:hypothetical protein BD410DRAFT_869267 [Rickenella mellea]|uniref:Uncharacterized protein n=1 Tax=Rickenella mellea TaxID=50990 RepID=A0A4Y7QKM2_9AGAM|nr:hypothetical protein BD410DRAFT_869267 [Rickenella mellea]